MDLDNELATSSTAKKMTSSADKTVTATVNKTETASKSTIAAKDKQDEHLSNLDKCWKSVPLQNSKLRLAGSCKGIFKKLHKGLKLGPKWMTGKQIR